MIRGKGRQQMTNTNAVFSFGKGFSITPSTERHLAFLDGFSSLGKEAEERVQGVSSWFGCRQANPWFQRQTLEELKPTEVVSDLQAARNMSGLKHVQAFPSHLSQSSVRINDVVNSRLCGCKTEGAEVTSLKCCHGLMSLALALRWFGQNQPEQNKKLDCTFASTNEEEGSRKKCLFC